MMVRSTHLSLLVTKSDLDMAQKAAELIEEQCNEALATRSLFNLAISGGKTPLSLFRLLSSPEWEKRIYWERTALYWVDERCELPDSPKSHYGIARRELLSRVPLTRFYRIKGEAHPEEAAEAYERLLRDHFCLGRGEAPRFDCIVLGLGNDGHTASIFPGQSAVEEKSRLVVDQYIHSMKSSRVTMTFPVFNNARCCIFMASGKEKHPVLSTALNLMAEPTLPAQMVRPIEGKLCWIIDEAAYKGA
ncbi:MAG: 6-phosphogluconolactonase [Deltaproteobacteria bacterium]|jgi:6-phosphogluconolactonase|nr:6-phosphogluconolactonase [Deltaproteobacteria bacterium]